jgi:hypothetical protein
VQTPTSRHSIYSLPLLFAPVHTSLLITLPTNTVLIQLVAVVLTDPLFTMVWLVTIPEGISKPFGQYILKDERSSVRKMFDTHSAVWYQENGFNYLFLDICNEPHRTMLEDFRGWGWTVAFLNNRMESRPPSTVGTAEPNKHSFIPSGLERDHRILRAINGKMSLTGSLEATKQFIDWHLKVAADWHEQDFAVKLWQSERQRRERALRKLDEESRRKAEEAQRKDRERYHREAEEARVRAMNAFGARLGEFLGFRETRSSLGRNGTME